MPTANTTVRLDARISTDLHAMLKRAADLQGRTMADFVVAAVQDAAQRAIEQAEGWQARRCCRRPNPHWPWIVPLSVAASSCRLNERRALPRR